MHVCFRVHHNHSGSREELLWTSHCSFLLGYGRSRHLPRIRLPHFHVRLPHPARQRPNNPELYDFRWYKREEAQKRFTAFFASTSLAGAFGGLFAYAISKLDGKVGLASWRWVFIVGVSLFPSPGSRIELTYSVVLEGLTTVVFAIVVFSLTADFPEEAKWLSDDEKAFVKAKLAEEFGDSQLDAKQTWRDVLGVLKDFKVILGASFLYMPTPSSPPRFSDPSVTPPS